MTNHTHHVSIDHLAHEAHHQTPNVAHLTMSSSTGPLTLAAPVPYSMIAHGTVSNGGSVQVLVLSNDGRWYKQENATVDGTRWSCRVCFGYPFSPKGSQYTMVAVTGKHIDPVRIKDIPADVIQSAPILVERE